MSEQDSQLWGQWCIKQIFRFRMRGLHIIINLSVDVLFSVFHLMSFCHFDLSGYHHRKLLIILVWWNGILRSDQSFLSWCLWLQLVESSREGEKPYFGFPNCRVWRYSLSLWHFPLFGSVHIFPNAQKFQNIIISHNYNGVGGAQSYLSLCPSSKSSLCLAV